MKPLAYTLAAFYIVTSLSDLLGLTPDVPLALWAIPQLLTVVVLLAYATNKDNSP